MAEVKVGKNETLDKALKRFKKQCARTGILSEVRRRKHYETERAPQKKAEAARKRRLL